MTKASIAAQKRYALTTVAPILGGVKGRFFLVSTRKTRTGISTKWDWDASSAKTWKTRARAEEFQFSHRYLKARIAVVKP